jgi:glycosyltransferase involved in cell wall biosynthesis
VRVVVDAMCADFGGIRTYVEHLVCRWGQVFPGDELHVVVPQSSTLDTAGQARHELVVRRPASVGRPFAQSVAMRRVVSQAKADVVLATAPTSTTRRLGVPLAVVVHDLRHELRPEQFSRRRRLLRRLSYGRTYSLADGFVAVSQRTLDDLHELHPELAGKPAFVAGHGADHVREWPEPSRKGPSVAFGHHTNKNPDLVVAAWGVLAHRGSAVPPLTILGLPSASRGRLEGSIAAARLGDHIRLAPYLDDREFRRVLAEADLVVFPSDFEGFGLPVVEGMTLGKPVVIGPEKATLEVSGGHAVVMEDWSAGALADAVERALVLNEDDLARARAWGAEFTWDRAVRDTRRALAGIYKYATDDPQPTRGPHDG